MSRISWREISRTPEKPGVYGWYFAPEITDFDLERAVSFLESLDVDDPDGSGAKFVESFLEQKLFRYLREDDYEAELRGPLKPSFAGRLMHRPSISKPLIERIVQRPDRLRTIKQVVEASAPDFASPLYIGMAKNLRSRLMRHKSLIESPDALVEPPDPADDGRQLARDRSFAERIRSRQIPTSRLFVAIRIVSDEAAGHMDVENILNRLHFPLLGRN